MTSLQTNVFFKIRDLFAQIISVKSNNINVYP